MALRLLLFVVLLGPLAACSQDVAPEAVAFDRGLVLLGPRIFGEMNGVPSYRREILFPVHTVDRIYKSMQGPTTSKRLRLGFAEEPELLWVTGYRSTVVEPDGVTEMSQEFMCHSNMRLVGMEHFFSSFRTRLMPTGGRLFTLSQGQLAIDLPDGFGLPIMSNQRVQLVAQVLNHNVVGRPFEVRQRLAVDFVRDKDLSKPLKPLLTRAVFAMKLVEGPDGYFGVLPNDVDPEKHGPGCMIGQDAGGKAIHDGKGREFTGFWVVPPGREVNRTPVTKLLGLPYDTTLHYVAVHLHPYAESVELRDLSSGETIYKSRASQADGKVGLARVEYFSSEEGIPLYADHEYEIVSIYENVTGEDQDAMATMFLYLHARDLFGAEVQAQ